MAVPSWTQAGRKTRPAHAECVSGFCQAAGKPCPWMKIAEYTAAPRRAGHHGDRRSLCPASAARC
ncbi:hypothetical protein C6A77_05265 [Pseudomonas sp. AFG_SD02_1510_Pfu_092]|nr:hypothetical protein C6A77_05265 [Pseudomonas sp. AFG_SD02_1510_Pfu_092]